MKERERERERERDGKTERLKEGKIFIMVFLHSSREF